MMGMVTSSYDVAAMIITPLISHIGGSRKKPVFCAWGVFTMGAGFFIFILPQFVSPPYEAGMSIMIGRSSLAYMGRIDSYGLKRVKLSFFQGRVQN